MKLPSNSGIKSIFHSKNTVTKDVNFYFSVSVLCSNFFNAVLMFGNKNSLEKIVIAKQNPWILFSLHVHISEDLITLQLRR